MRLGQHDRNSRDGRSQGDGPHRGKPAFEQGRDMAGLDTNCFTIPWLEPALQQIDA
jgi:hypothetical protein